MKVKELIAKLEKLNQNWTIKLDLNPCENPEKFWVEEEIENKHYILWQGNCGT